MPWMRLAAWLGPAGGALMVSVWGIAQAINPAVSGMDVSTMTTDQLILAVIKEGGAWGLVALLLWFYRRDWLRLADQTKPLIDIVSKSLEAQKESAVALTKHTEVLRDLADEIRAIRGFRP